MSVVLGGGVGGLAVCHYLMKQGGKQRVHLLEACDRLGGWIRTTAQPDGPLFEHGPRTVRPRGELGANTLELVEELGLTDKVVPILSNHPAALNRLIYVNGELYTLPSSFLSLFTTRAPFSKPLLSALFHDLRSPKIVKTDESIYDFVSRRLGPELADYAISPMICGICAGDARKISVKFLMKSLFEAEQKHGSIVQGMFRQIMDRGGKSPNKPSDSELAKRAVKERWSVWSLAGGLEQLTLAMESNIIERGVDVRLLTTCREITFANSRTVVKASFADINCDRIFSSLPAFRLAPLVAQEHPELAEELSGIPFVDVAVVNLQYSGDVLDREAFGFLIPPAENVPILGVIFDSCCFPRNGQTVLTAMMGGNWFEEHFGSNPSDEVLLNTAVESIGKILNISAQPESYKVSVLRKCIPQYVVGHHDRVERIRAYISKHDLPLTLCGSSYDGVGVNDVIMSARRAVG